MSAVLALLKDVVVTEPLAGFLKAIDLDPIDPATGKTLADTVVPGLLGCVLPGGSTVQVGAGAGGGEPLTITFQNRIAPPAGVVAAVAAGADANGRRPVTKSGTLAIDVTGSAKIVVAGGVGQLRFDGLRLALAPQTILLPGGFGLILPGAIAISGGSIDFGSVEVVLPSQIPLLGDLAVPASVTSDDHGGLTLTASLPADFAAPGLTGSLTWHLGAGFSLADLVPTGLDMALTYPSPGAGGGRPVEDGPVVEEPMILRLTGSRDPKDPGSFTSSLGASSAAPDGLLSIGPGSTPEARAAGIAVALGTAVCARGGGPTVPATGLFAAALGLAGLTTRGGAVLHGVSVETSSGAESSLAVDVSGTVTIKPLKFGPVTVSMTAERPMRVRWRNVRLVVDPGADATVDLTEARPEVADPGGWTVDSPGSLLDVIGTRSGAGSTWVEVDLRFMLDLGPLKISGATIRATYDEASETFDVALRGLAATLDIPGLITGSGQVALRQGAGDEQGISLGMSATVIPLDLGAIAFFSTRVKDGVRMTYLAFGVDLPAPIPLGPSGLGLYGAGGSFGVNAAMPPLGDDPLTALRSWTPWHPDAVEPRAGNLTLGVGVVVGTLPDAGFIFNARGVLGITAPDLALRIGMQGKLAGSRYRLADLNSIVAKPADTVGLQFFGGLSVDSSALCVALEGSYNLPYVVSARLPVVARFPIDGDASRWYLRAGSDNGLGGVSGRPPGPIVATVLPGTPLATSGWAFVMIEGAGIRSPGLLGKKDSDGFTVAVGAGLSTTLGVKGLVWAEINASVVAMIATSPMFFWAHAEVGGEFGIGPFSIGLSAALDLEVGPGHRFGVELELCGEVDLWLTTLRKCIAVRTPAAALTLPDPNDSDWPFPQISLTDGLGRSLANPAQLTAAAGTGPAPDVRSSSGAGNIVPLPGGQTLDEAGWKKTPVVWPDTIPLLTFKVAPLCVDKPNLGNDGVNTGTVSSGRLTYTWRLHSVTVNRVDGTAPGVVGAGTCAWQAPSGVSAKAVGVATQRPLALLTTSTDVGKQSELIVHRETGDDPAELAGSHCTLRAPYGRGWAWGRDATSSGAHRWRVRREYDAAGTPLVLRAFARGTGFTVNSVAVERAQASIVGPYAAEGPRVFGPTEVEGRSVGTALQLLAKAAVVQGISPQSRWASIVGAQHTITFDETVVEGELFLILRPLVGTEDDLLGVLERYPVTMLRQGAAEKVAAQRYGEHRVFCLPIKDAGDPATGVVVGLPAWVSVSVVGLSALTVTDRDAAATADDDADAVTADALASTRVMLVPGARYRIDVELSWARTYTDKDGKPQTSEYGGGGQTRIQSWYFRTAPKPSAAKPSVSLLAMYDVERFEPAYLQRYLRGYDRPDRADYVFAADIPWAAFGVTYLPDLLAKYGRRPVIAVRRTDKRATGIGWRAPAMTLTFDPTSFFEARRAESAARSGCPTPPTGSKLGWTAPLETSAAYELAVAFPAPKKAPTASTPRLDPITFRTSAYRNAGELIKAMRLYPVSPARAADASDLPVTVPPNGFLTGGDRRGDATLEELLRALGLPPQVPVTSGQTTVLWVPGGSGWQVLGMWLQNPEPIIRPGRLELGASMTISNQAAPSRKAAARYVNSAGSGVLWLLAAPLAPSSKGYRFDVEVTDRDPAKTSHKSVVRRARCGRQPAFARGVLRGAQR